MYQIPFNDRRNLFVFLHASQTFSQARNVLKFLRESQFKIEAWMSYALWTSFSVYYFRPFRQKKPDRSFSLPESIVPDEFRKAHNELNYSRNKVHAHNEFDFERGALGPVNTVSLYKKSNNEWGLGIGFDNPNLTDEYYDHLLALLDYLVTETRDRGIQILTNWSVKLHCVDPDISKVWHINISPDSDDLFIPSKIPT